MVTPNVSWDRKWFDMLISRMHLAGSERRLPAPALPPQLRVTCSGSFWEWGTQSHESRGFQCLRPTQLICLHCWPLGKIDVSCHLRTSTLHKDEVVKKYSDMYLRGSSCKTVYWENVCKTSEKRWEAVDQLTEAVYRWLWATHVS